MNATSKHLDPEALYEAHAARLYAYCWALVGDDAPAALRETFAAAARHDAPRDDVALWLHALARGVCLQRGAPDHTRGHTQDADPLRRAAATLRTDHREVLLLTGGQWLESADIGRLLGIGTDAAADLIRVARGRLERAVLDLLLREPAATQAARRGSARGAAPAGAAPAGAAPPWSPAAPDEEIIRAFEEGRLDVLLARRAPDRPPARLRQEAVTAFTTEAAHPLPTTSSPLVVIDPAADPDPGPEPTRRVQGVARSLGLAACVAAAVGLAAVWPGPRTGGSTGDAFDSLGPTTAATRRAGPLPGGTPTPVLSGAPAQSPSGTPSRTPGATPSAPPGAVPGTPPGGTPNAPGASPGTPGTPGTPPGVAPGGGVAAAPAAPHRKDRSRTRAPGSRAAAAARSARPRSGGGPAGAAAPARTRSAGAQAARSSAAKAPPAPAPGRAPDPPPKSRTPVPSRASSPVPSTAEQRPAGD